MHLNFEDYSLLGYSAGSRVEVNRRFRGVYCSITSEMSKPHGILTLSKTGWKPPDYPAYHGHFDYHGNMFTLVDGQSSNCGERARTNTLRNIFWLDLLELLD
jgi:hypothetical protein